jgi:hypothetical protein
MGEMTFLSSGMDHGLALAVSSHLANNIDDVVLRHSYVNMLQSAANTVCFFVMHRESTRTPCIWLPASACAIRLLVTLGPHSHRFNGPYQRPYHPSTPAGHSICAQVTWRKLIMKTQASAYTLDSSKFVCGRENRRALVCVCVRVCHWTVPCLISPIFTKLASIKPVRHTGQLNTLWSAFLCFFSLQF